MTKLKDIFEAKINGQPSPLEEGMQISKDQLEKAFDILMKKGRDFITTNMVWVELNKMAKTTFNVTLVANTLKKKLEPVQGKPGYYDLASYGTIKEGKTETHPWAAEMSEIIKSVAPTVAKKLQGIEGSEGTIVSKMVGDKIIAAFKAAGFKPYEQIDDLFVIDAKKKKGVGVSVDYREDMDYGKNKGLVIFFDDNH